LTSSTQRRHRSVCTRAASPVLLGQVSFLLENLRRDAVVSVGAVCSLNCSSNSFLESTI
jgi:hypothetical protein